jgi:hypothetical protein
MSGISCSFASACTAIGYNTAGQGGDPNRSFSASWTGSSWAIHNVAPPPGASFETLMGISCSSPTRCVSVGEMITGAAEIWPAVEFWDGTTWLPGLVPTPAGSDYARLSAISCSSENACVAVGSFGTGCASNSGCTTHALAETWNGRTWSIENLPGLSDAREAELHSVSCATPSACIAVGFSDPANSNQDYPLAESWNGSGWTIAPTPPTYPGVAAARLSGVSCPAVDACATVGYQGFRREFHGEQSQEPLVDRWNGSNWTIERTPALQGPFNGAFTALSCVSPSSCAAVGTGSVLAGDPFESGTVPVSLVERYS